MATLIREKIESDCKSYTFCASAETGLKPSNLKFNNEIIDACENDCIIRAKQLYTSEEKINDVCKHITELKSIFTRACADGDVELVNSLLRISCANDTDLIGEMFKLACDANKLDIAKLLYSRGCYTAKVIAADEYFVACFNGHIKLAQWLYKIS